MENGEIRELHAARTSEGSRSAVAALKDACHRYRLLAVVEHGTTGALPEAWQSYGTVEKARIGAREMLHNQRVQQVAIIEDRPPLQFVEWIGR